MREGHRRTLLVAAWIVVVLAAMTVPEILLWNRLPDPIATHWGAGGHPNGSESRLWGLGFFAGIWIALGLVLTVPSAWFARRRPPYSRRNVFAGGLLGLFGGLGIGVQSLTLWSNLDRATWRDARPVGWLLSALPLVAGAVGAVAGTWIDRRTAAPVEPMPAGGAIGIAPGERAAWLSHASNRWMSGIGALVLVAGIVATVIRTGSFGLPFVIIGLLCLALSTITVSVGAAGVRVALGRWGWPARRIGLTKISAARAERFRPLQVGGWGLRGLPGSSALMVRGGDCLVLEYRSGGRFVISVDDAAQGAALVNGLLERAADSAAGDHR
jgi:Protein of unknown function (DUF1648)